MKQIMEEKAQNYKNGKINYVTEKVVKDSTITLTINNEISRSLSAIEDSLEEFAVGYLFNENMVKSIDDIEKIEINENHINVEIDDKLLEGKKKYVAVQEEMNEIVQLINQAQRRFMASYKEVHQIISTMPSSLNDIEEEGEVKMAIPEPAAAEETEELHLGDTQELDFMDALQDMAELEEFDEEDSKEEMDEDSQIAMQISRLLSEEDEFMMENEEE